MLKIFYKVNTLLTIILILSILTIPSISIAQANRAAMDGSFITGDLCGLWSDARWQKEFTAMKECRYALYCLSISSRKFPR